MSRGGIAWPTVAAAVVLIGAATSLLIMSGTIPQQARLYPQIFLLAILAGSVALAIETVLRGWRPQARSAAAAAGSEEAAAPTGPESGAGFDPDRAGWPLYPALVIYVLVLDPLGFVVSTALFLAGVLLWLRMSAKIALPLAIIGVLLIFAVFRTVMYVSLPAGPVDIYLLELIYSR